jgi:DNA-binding HxlR family transcriptional regulator
MPLPGQPVRGSRSGRPIMAALDLLGRRWTLRLLWELRGGPLGARELRRRCDDVSPSVLYSRIAELSDAGLVRQDSDDRYVLTAVGAELRTAIEPLDAWAEGWARSQRRARTRRR